MAMNNIPHFPSFDMDTDRTNAGTRWEKWLSRLENLFVGMKLEDENQMRALLLHYAGEKVFDIYDVEKKDSETTYDATKKVLVDYFSPKKNKQMEVYNFRTYKQKEGQSLDEFVTELRTLAKNCEFSDIDNEILQQIIQNCNSNQLRRRALREPSKGLNDILTLGRMLEQSDRQAALMESSANGYTKDVQSVSKPRNRGSKWRPTGMSKGCPRPDPRRRPGQRQLHANEPQDKLSRDGATPNRCKNCGYEFPHRTAPCPAKGKRCNYCGKPNHFSRCCRQRGKPSVREVTDLQSSSEDEYAFNLGTHGNKTPTTRLKLNGNDLKVTVDTGSSVNIIDENTYRIIGKPQLGTRKLPKLMPYGGGPNIHVKGSCQITVEKNGKITVEQFYLVKGNYGTLLGYKTACDLNIVKIVQNIDREETIDKKYPGIFNGIGKLKGRKVKLHINENVKPVAQKGRRTPFHLRKRVEKELDKMIADDIIEEVQNESTPWVSPIVTPPKKNGDVRICVDMREANRAIERERHPMPTIDELIHDLNGATVFSKLDLKSGYNQLVLDESSRSITTFSTHMGIFRYKRLNFGTNSASEVFQKTISSVIQSIKGAKNISDDILIYGNSQGEHDAALHKVLKALHTNGLTLNKGKCEFNKTEVTFFGVVFKSNGISPDPLKVEAIRSIGNPTNVSELRSFLGMTSYCSRFINDYASITEPLRRLTRKDTQWTWGKRQQYAFEELKRVLSGDTVITYFDPNKDTELLTDASPVGVSGILAQEGKVVAYASRALTQTESRYSQTEREALGVVWACEHYNMYLRGAPCFTVVTDHKPLTTIWLKKQPPLRIERWGLRLQPFKMNIVYKPGKDNPSDYMSRHPIQMDNNDDDLAEEYVAFISSEAIPHAMTLDEVKIASLKDKTMQKAIEYAKTGKWHEIKTVTDPDIDIEELLSYRSVKDELTVHCETVLLRNDKIVMPKVLRPKAIKLAHEGHQGIARTKSYIRSKVWFPNINEMVESAIRGCIACQANTREKKPREPLKMSEMPAGPWQNLSADFCGPLNTGEYLLVITDEYSRYPAVEIVRSLSANTVIPVFDRVISMFGIPNTVKTDNGSPFNSAAFANYAKYIGFTHRKVTPRWPRANAQAESFNKPLMKCVKSACIEGKSWKQELYRFLRQYRASPHTSTGYTPYRLMFGRDPNTRLPEIKKCSNDKKSDENARQNDERIKARSKKYQDKLNNASEREFKIGDKVLLENENKTKMASFYKPNPYIITEKKGSMITAENNKQSVTRNSSCMKKVADHLTGHQPEPETDDDDDTHLDTGSTNENVTRRSTRERRAPRYLSDYVR